MLIKYSIITPVYNRADCIARCMESVVRQLQWNVLFEHIIVDDGSSDQTAEIIGTYEQKYSHIKFIRFPKNRGTNAARNAAINNAEGQFCIFLDSDDYFVDEALNIIDSTIQNHSEYKHYLFAPDDCITYYANNPLLNKGQGIVTFKDFFLDKVCGDFIHVVDRLIMKKFPFNEEIIIYEGIFFLQFYKTVNQLLFTNKIVTIRERSRSDSVSRLVLRIDRKSIYNKIIAIRLNIDWFENDYIKFGAENKVIKLKLELLENYLLLSDYQSARLMIRELNKCKIAIPFRYLWIMNFRLGDVFRLMLKSYLVLKYSVLKHRIG